ncbi:MAG: DUF262 domain-containing protein [Melioribacteraceae bacterium]|nr:DUF262 domain-containing protein [Melioribacteraceae bacterium]
MAKSRFSEEGLDAILNQVKEKSRLYDYRTKDYPFEVICTKYGDEDNLGATLYVPKYQREFIWKPDRQSKFIESVLLGVPLTPFLVSEDEDSRLEIIDGSQRIRTLIAFFENRLRLRKLEKLTEINRAKFSDLPITTQNYIKNRDFRIIVVDNAEIEIRQDIFERINTTSEKLTDAEIRKGSYSGKFYDLVLELKSNTDFVSICPISKEKEKRGEYDELILRFFAYIDKYLEFKHDVAIFLNDYLEEMNDTDFDKIKYQDAFLLMVKFIQSNFTIGFRKEQNSNSTPRVRFEAISVGTYLALNENPELGKPNLEWLNSEGFKIQTTADSSNNPGRLKSRIEFVRDGLLGKLDNNRLQNG